MHSRDPRGNVDLRATAQLEARPPQDDAPATMPDAVIQGAADGDPEGRISQTPVSQMTADLTEAEPAPLP